jgi:transposase-like protein
MKTAKTELKPEEMTLVKLAQDYVGDEAKSRALLESWRWPNGPVCPHCQNGGAEKPNSKLSPKADSKHGVRDGVYFCGACREQFSVTVGTIFESSHLPISTWLMAIFLMSSSKKSISAHQIHRMLGITYKSAWFLTHRIRHAMGPDMPLGKLMKGTVEVDETFVGGVGDARTKSSRKTPVVALVERDGAVKTKVVANVTQRNLGRIINEYVDKSAVVNTDDSGVYRGQLKAFKGHHVVNHSKEEYARTNADGSVAHVNTAESFFSLLKRGVVGSWHHVSKEHLAKYAEEFAFRWTHRKGTDGERMKKAIEATGGKRLTYRQPIATGKSGFDLLVKKAESPTTEPNQPEARKIFREPTDM